VCGLDSGREKHGVHPSKMLWQGTMKISQKSGNFIKHFTETVEPEQGLANIFYGGPH